ncbi:hypothetical protein ACP70R_038538 [Stipagrostis hirtigluma subsp. patula]
MHQLKPREAAALPREALEAHIVSLLRRCRGLLPLRGAHAHLVRLRLPRLTAAFALSKLLASCADATAAAAPSYARNLFDQIPDPTAFCYNSLIRALSAARSPAASGEPFLVYRRMLRAASPSPNSFTLAFALKACAAAPALGEGRQLHAQAFRRGLVPSPYVQTGLLNLYAKCQEVALARTVFDGMVGDKNLAAWSAMIGGYSRVGMANEALGLFREMQAAGVEPDEVTMVSVISACAKAGALDLGRWVHAYIDRKGIKIDLELSTALIDMYAKCGLIERARGVFDAMVERDTKAWSAMIVGLAIHGLVEDALGLFSRMLALKVRPNNVTFIGVLSACAHSGLVDDGRRYWSTMQKLGIEPSMENYGCMVDLLCRSGLLDDAYSFVTNMPISPNSVIWRSLLVASKSSDRIDIVESASKRLLELEPLNPENYVLLSNLYASSSQWDRVSYMRKKMKDSNVTPVPGCSSIEINGYLHKFVVSDDSHPEIKEIRLVKRKRKSHFVSIVKGRRLEMSQSTSQPRPVEAEELYDVAHMGAPGVRFVPADKELIAHYLQRQLRGEPLPADVVHVGDVYAEHPMNLVRELDRSLEGSWYMFSPRSRKHPNGMRPRRRTGDDAGFWKSMGAKRVVRGADGREVIGHKCGLTFHEFVDEQGDGHVAGDNPPAKRKRRGKKPTEWKMLELVSADSDMAPDDAAADPMLLNEWVLCRITNRTLEGWVDRGSAHDSEGEEEEQAASSAGDASHDGERQLAAAEAPNGGHAAATAAEATASTLHQPESGDGLYHGANPLDDYLQQFSWSDGLLNLDNYVETADDGAESSQDRQPAEQQQAASGGGAGSRDEPKQGATPQAPDGGGAAAATGKAPGDHDWRRRWCGNPQCWDSLCGFDDFDDHINAT